MSAKRKRRLIVFSLGATISNKDEKIDTEALSSISTQFKTLLESLNNKYTIVAVAGGGGLSRKYSEFAKTKIKNNVDYHSLGIKASQLNALLLCSTLRKDEIITKLSIPLTWPEFERSLSEGNFECIVLGGIVRGMTSDSTAALVAHKNESNLVIVSTVGGIYASQSKNGELPAMLKAVNSGFLENIVATKPREHVLDVETCKILLDSRGPSIRAIVTGYPNIFEATRKMLTLKSTKIPIAAATRIVV